MMMLSKFLRLLADRIERGEDCGEHVERLRRTADKFQSFANDREIKAISNRHKTVEALLENAKRGSVEDD